MKKIYMLMAVAAMCAMGANAQTEGSLELGKVKKAGENYYDGGANYSAPMNFYYKHSGAQIIYTATDLKQIADLTTDNEVKITELEFPFWATFYTEFKRNVKMILQESDATEFVKDQEKKKYKYFEFDKNDVAYTGTFEYTYEYANNEGGVLKLTLNKPFNYTGKSIIVTVMADDDEATGTTDGAMDVPFYPNENKKRAMSFCNDNKSFIDHAGSQDFPYATSSVSYSTPIEQPITTVKYSYTAKQPQTGIADVIVNNSAQDNGYYNMMGQKVAETNLTPGIYIHKGKKLLVK